MKGRVGGAWRQQGKRQLLQQLPSEARHARRRRRHKGGRASRSCRNSSRCCLRISSCLAVRSAKHWFKRFSITSLDGTRHRAAREQDAALTEDQFSKPQTNVSSITLTPRMPVGSAAGAFFCRAALGPHQPPAHHSPRTHRIPFCGAGHNQDACRPELGRYAALAPRRTDSSRSIDATCGPVMSLCSRGAICCGS